MNNDRSNDQAIVLSIIHIEIDRCSIFLSTKMITNFQNVKCKWRFIETWIDENKL